MAEMAKFRLQFGKEEISKKYGENGKFVKIANNLEANANERTRGAPWKADEFGKFGENEENGKFVKIANNLEANANERTRGASWKADEFGECGEYGEKGRFVKIANNLQTNANEETRGAPWKAGEYGEYGENLHTFGNLTKFRHNRHICQNCQNRQIVGDILLFCQFCYCVHFWT